MNFQKCLGVLLILSLQIVPVPSWAVKVSLSTKAKLHLSAGIDKPTRDLIEKMPAAIREEILVAMDGALERLDTSVESYLEEVDRILADRLALFSCALTGASKNAIEEFFKNVKIFSRVGITPVGTLRKEINALPGTLNKDDSPATYRQAYGDLLANAANTGCQVENTPLAYSEVVKMRVELTGKARPWIRVDEVACSNARTCLAVVAARTNTKMQSADPRDVASADAVRRMKGVTMPRESILPFAKFDHRPYEDGIQTAFEISDAIGVATVIRMDLARNEILNAEVMVSSLEGALAEGKAATGTSKARVEQAIKSVEARKSDKQLIEKAVASAITTAVEEKAAGGALLQRVAIADANIAPTLERLRLSHAEYVKAEQAATATPPKKDPPPVFIDKGGRNKSGRLDM